MFELKIVDTSIRPDTKELVFVVAESGLEGEDE